MYFNSNYRASSFGIGDKIVVVKGELENLSGIVTGVNEVTNMVQIRLLDDSIGLGDISLEAGDLGKLFTKGDRCKVTNGRYCGDTGIIMHTEALEEGGWVAVLYTDISCKEISVFMRDLTLSDEIAGAINSLNGYEMYDLGRL